MCIGNKDDWNSVIFFPFSALMVMVLLPLLQVGITLLFSISSKLKMTLGTCKAAWFLFVGLVNTCLCISLFPILYGNRSSPNFLTSLLQVKAVSGLDEIGTRVTFQT